MQNGKILGSLILLEEKACIYELADNNNKPFSATQYAELLKSIDIIQKIYNNYKYNVITSNPFPSISEAIEDAFKNPLDIDMVAKEDRKYIKTFLKH